MLIEGTNLHNFCQSEALPDRFLVQKVSLNVLYICDLINFFMLGNVFIILYGYRACGNEIY